MRGRERDRQRERGRVMVSLSVVTVSDMRNLASKVLGLAYMLRYGQPGEAVG